MPFSFVSRATRPFDKKIGCCQPYEATKNNSLPQDYFLKKKPFIGFAVREAEITFPFPLPRLFLSNAFGSSGIYPGKSYKKFTKSLGLFKDFRVRLHTGKTSQLK